MTNIERLAEDILHMKHRNKIMAALPLILPSRPTAPSLQRLNTRNARQAKAYVDVLYKFEMEERERCSGLR